MADSPSSSLRQARVTAFAIGFGPLVRPDFAIFTVLFLIAVLVMAGKATTTSKTRRRMVGLLAVGLAVPMAYELFRMGFYASLVPNTAFAKEASEAWWSQGLRYLWDFLRPYWLLAPLAAAALLLAAGAQEWRHRRNARVRSKLLVAAAPFLGGLLHGLYVVRAGGDFMHARFLLPSLFAVMLPVAVVEVRGLVQWAAVAVVVPWAVLCATQLRIDYSRHHGLNDGHGIADERRFYSQSAERFNPVDTNHWSSFILYKDGQEADRLSRTDTRLLAWRSSAGEPAVYTGVPLRPDLPFEAAYITGNLGITGVRAGRHVHIIDPSGLSDPFAGRVRLTARGRPGHEKRLDFAWIQARFADPQGVADHAAHQINGGTIQPAPGAVAAARRALRCGELRDIDAAVTEPLTPARFLRNMVLAVRLHSFRLDPDPVVAEARLCRD
jgi:arabinofuranosyltransferase